MNQILVNGHNRQNNSLCIKKNNKNNIYKALFIFSILLLLISIIFLFVKLYKNSKNERISQKLNASYSVSTLYSKNIISNSIVVDKSEPFVIGIIKIDKINVNYSILSISNNELLDISVCRFAGPMPNEIGNLCIAGHNYVDYKFFSRLNELIIGDIITIYDLNGNNINYKIYDKYETTYDNTSCTFQETNGLKLITLVTCNNVNGKRLVIHAKEIP